MRNSILDFLSNRTIFYSKPIFREYRINILVCRLATRLYSSETPLGFKTFENRILNNLRPHYSSILAPLSCFNIQHESIRLFITYHSLDRVKCFDHQIIRTELTNSLIDSLPPNEFSRFKAISSARSDCFTRRETINSILDYNRNRIIHENAAQPMFRLSLIDF